MRLKSLKKAWSLLEAKKGSLRSWQQRERSARTQSPRHQRWLLSALGAGVIGTAALPRTAAATEGVLFGGPVGGTDIGQAYLPPPGSLFFFGGLIGGHSSGIYSNNGGHVHGEQANLTGTFQDFVGFLYTYPIKFLGGTLGSTIELPANYGLCIGVAPQGQAYQSQCITGQGDVYSDLLIWSKHLGTFGAQPPAPNKRLPLPYGLTAAAALGLIIPTGEYREDARLGLTVGHNAFIYVPSISLTYLTGPNIGVFGADGTEFSMRTFYDISVENPENGYRSGNVFAFDTAVSERFGKLQLGATVSMGDQTSPDKVRGPGITAQEAAGEMGDYFGLLDIGPVASYDISAIGTSAKIKYLHSIWGRNTLHEDAIIFSIAKAIF